MFGISLWHVLIVLLLVALFFGRGRISGLMGDLGRGINAFRREMNWGAPPKSPTSLTDKNIIDVTPTEKKD